MTFSKQKLALVSGTAGAIGGATASLLARKGWRVIGLDLRRSNLPEDLAGEVVGDAATSSAWEAALSQVWEAGGELHGLVHCAAYHARKPLVEMTEDEWHRVMDVNLASVYQSARLLHGALASARGSVVAVGSVHARATSNNVAAYAASKGGLSALVRALAIEWAPDGIRVNAVLPGAVDTAMLLNGSAGGERNHANRRSIIEALAEKTVMGRIGQPEELASGICFLLDNSESSYVTGSELVVDGGAAARLSTE